MGQGNGRRRALEMALLALLLGMSLLLFHVLTPPPTAIPEPATGGAQGPRAATGAPAVPAGVPAAPERVRVRRAEGRSTGPASRPEEDRYPLVVKVFGPPTESGERLPVVGAEIALIDPDEPSLPEGELPQRTDAEGLAELFPVGNTRVYARHGRHAALSGVVVVGRSEDRRLELLLGRAIEVRGRVVDEEGGALPDTRLQLSVPASRRTARPLISSPRPRPLPQTATVVVPLDAAGRFALPALPVHGRDGATLHARLSGHVPVAYEIPGDPGAFLEVEILMQRAVRVRGRVIAAGSPAEEFEAISVRPGSRIAMPGPHPGEFVFPPLPARGGTFVVKSEGFAPKAVSWPSTSAPELDMGDIHLDAGHTLEGLVLWPDGTPAGGAKVQTRSDHVEGLRVIGGSAPDGSFSFPHLAAVEHRIEAERGGGNAWISSREHASRTDTILPRFGRAVVGPVVPGGGPVRVVLETGRVVILRFVDSRTGEVTEVHSPRFTARTRGASRSAAGSHYLGIACAVAFHLDVPGPWRIEIESETHEPVVLDLVNVADTERRDVALTPKSDGAE